MLSPSSADSGVVYVLDAAEDPFTQVNTMLIGIIES